MTKWEEKKIYSYIFTKKTPKIHYLARFSYNLLFKNWKCNNVEVKTHLMGRLRLYFCWQFLDPRTSWRKSTSEITCNEISILFSFPRAFAFINQGSSTIKNKVILIKYSRPIWMFPATHRLRTTGLGCNPVYSNIKSVYQLFSWRGLGHYHCYAMFNNLL
jgi:hypothetical protein